MVAWCKACQLMVEGSTRTVAATEADRSRVETEEFSALSVAMVSHVFSSHPEAMDALNQSIAITASIEAAKMFRCEHEGFARRHDDAIAAFNERLRADLPLVVPGRS